MPNQVEEKRFGLGNAEDMFLRDSIRRGATRRDLMGWFAALGLGAGGLPLFDAAGRALAATPKRGGRVRIAGSTTATTDTLDPPKGSNATDYARHYMFFNGLTTLDENLIAQPTLATSIESTDAVNWTIKLRSDVRFHDGSKLTSADVVYSLTRHKDPETGSKVRAIAMQMEEISAGGPSEVKVRLSSPNADFPVVVGVSHFLIVKDGATDFSKPNGTGPYRCKEFTPGVRSIAVRNDDYWKPGQPYLDEIEFIGINDNSARVNALLSGDVQMIGGVPATSARQLQRTPGVELLETKGGFFTNIVMRSDMAPTSNPDFVLAVKYMLDREQMRRTVFRDYAVIGNDNPIDPANRYFNKDLPQRAYDPEKAKFHLRKANIGASEFAVTVSSAASASEDMAQLWQQSAKAAGLDLTLRRVPPDGYWSNQWMKHPITFGATNARPTADLMLSLYFKSDSPWNESGWKNERFDQMLISARGEINEARRKQIYGDMQALISNECSIGIPVFRSVIDAHSNKLKGLRPVPLGNMMGYTFPEHIWLDA